MAKSTRTRDFNFTKSYIDIPFVLLTKVDFETSFKACIENIMSNLPSHRMHNFMGAVLSHHSMRSTEYMAKWIEAKNKT